MCHHWSCRNKPNRNGKVSQRGNQPWLLNQVQRTQDLRLLSLSWPSAARLHQYHLARLGTAARCSRVDLGPRASRTRTFHHRSRPQLKDKWKNRNTHQIQNRWQTKDDKAFWSSQEHTPFPTIQTAKRSRQAPAKQRAENMG